MQSTSKAILKQCYASRQSPPAWVSARLCTTISLIYISNLINTVSTSEQSFEEPVQNVLTWLRLVHGGAPFLPWHRYFVQVYNNALSECGYDGPGTYVNFEAVFMTSC
jgi:hypothetical protein